MGIRLIFLNLLVVTDAGSCTSLSDWMCSLGVPGNSPSFKTVPQTDTGGQVEHTKALERTMLKELGKMLPYLRKKGASALGNQG
tara:strand:- start:59 stop:310 length:252 start_codon:yes stop_codon:yes gene_type:complete